MNKETGYPHIDKPWMKYYDEKIVNLCDLYIYCYEHKKSTLCVRVQILITLILLLK